jgi:hypothetical protein
MSAAEKIKSYISIINLLKKRPCSFEEIQNNLQSDSEITGLNLCRTKRTFFRDVESIKIIFGINIEFDTSISKYKIIEYHPANNLSTILDSYELTFMINTGTSISKFVQLEEFAHYGREYFLPLIKAMKDKMVVRFAYKKYLDDLPEWRTIEPYGLKEFRRKWYLVGKDREKGEIRVFGLDRMSNLETTTIRFDYPEQFRISEIYNNVFGITLPAGNKTEGVELEFSKKQGVALKEIPLHHSQKILSETAATIQFSLDVCITPDLIHEILSYGEQVKVIGPASLKEAVISRLKNALAQYDN